MNQKFPRSGGMRYLMIDSCYDWEDDEERIAFDTSMESLWVTLETSPPLTTNNVKQVETDNKKLKDQIQAKETMLQEIRQKR